MIVMGSDLCVYERTIENMLAIPCSRSRPTNFKFVPKKQEDVEALINTIREAGVAILGLRPVTVPQIVMDKRHRGTFAICPRCHESYPAADGLICCACLGELTYIESGTKRKPC
jgi:hypothetical protein